MTNIKTAYAVVTAAGMGTRLGSDRPKALLKIGEKTMLEHALEQVNNWAQMPDAPLVCGVVTVPAEYVDDFQEIISSIKGLVPWLVVTGGNTRQESVYAGMRGLFAFSDQANLEAKSTLNGLPVKKVTFPQTAASAKNVDSPTATDTPNSPASAAIKTVKPAAPNSAQSAVLIHDAARCFTPASLFAEIFSTLDSGIKAVIPVLPVVDTIREIEPEPATNGEKSNEPSGSILERAGQTLNRANLRAVQTPQGFRGDIIFAAHKQFADNPSAASWDDALLVKASGEDHFFLPGRAEALKITTPWDLKIATLLWGTSTNH